MVIKRKGVGYELCTIARDKLVTAMTGVENAKRGLHKRSSLSLLSLLLCGALLYGSDPVRWCVVGSG